jgi:hypothetical protein
MVPDFSVFEIAFVQFAFVISRFELNLKSITLAFKDWFSEAGFGELTFPDFLVFEIAFVQFTVVISHCS